MFDFWDRQGFNFGGIKCTEELEAGFCYGWLLITANEHKKCAEHMDLTAFSHMIATVGQLSSSEGVR